MSAGRRRAWSAGLTGALVVLAVLALVAAGFGVFRQAVGGGGTAGAAAGPGHRFGTLQTAPERAAEEYAHGLRIAHLQIDWARFEPERGVYDEGYAREVRDRLRTFRDAGLEVEAGLGLNHPPDWLADAYPESVWRDQYGDTSTAVPNIVFSAPVRDEVGRYVRRVAERIGLDGVAAIRVGIDENGELGYPRAVSDGRATGSFWAYDPHAQAASPYPGWRPGETTYRGAPFGEDQVTRWYEWYLGELADAVDWQLGLFGELAPRAELKVLVPGAGYYPSDYRRAVSHHLDDDHTARLIGRGIGLFRVLGLIGHGDRVHVVTTALVDGTGSPVDNGCSPADPARLPTASDATVRAWSSARWVVAVARAEGFRHIDGESAGQQVAAYRPGVMAAAFHQFDSCGLGDLLWAFDHNLYDGTPGSSLADYTPWVRDRSGRRVEAVTVTGPVTAGGGRSAAGCRCRRTPEGCGPSRGG
ncbi:beta-galactosidase [Streptomyces sp. NPDC090025]|uniref:beta-galactosidase n=1 Tax=Streptomyces sp. NPDC090025 TaxID=3365922 RepID=UPI003836EB41